MLPQSLLNAGSNIKVRHEIIKPVIGVFPEEEEAFTLVSLLMWLLPTIVILGALLDFALFYLFSTKFHPWVGILLETERPLDELVLEGEVVENEDVEKQENQVGQWSNKSFKCFLKS